MVAIMILAFLPLGCKLYSIVPRLIQFIASFSVAIILKLVEGHYPVCHPSDYVSVSDKKALPSTKPKLVNMSNKVTLHLNIKITSMSTFKLLQNVISNRKFFNTIITTMSVCPSLSRSQLSEVLSFFGDCYYHDICFSPSLVSATQVMPNLLPGGCLRLHSFNSLPNNTTSLENILHTKPSTVFVGNYLKEIFILLRHTPILVFGVLPDIENSHKKINDCLESLKFLLHANDTHMKYLQLNRFPSALIGQLELTALRNLQVLNIASKTVKTKSLLSPAEHVCTILQNLDMLEYFSWTDTINIFSKELISMHETLKSSLPRLAHWHMSSFKVVLFTNISAAEREKMAYIYDNLMKGKFGDEVCSTFKFSLDSVYFRIWLAFARPDVCFNFKTSHIVDQRT